MSFRKYQSVEKTKVVDPEEARRIGAATRKVGKTSVREMTPDEKRTLPNGGVDTVR